MRKQVIRIATAFLLAAGLCCSCDRGQVTLVEDEQTYTLDNGIVSAVVAKASGDLVSLQYKGKEMLATRMGWFDGQMLSGRRLLGCALMLLASILAQLPSRKRAV